MLRADYLPVVSVLRAPTSVCDSVRVRERFPQICAALICTEQTHANDQLASELATLAFSILCLQWSNKAEKKDKAAHMVANAHKRRQEMGV